MDYRSMLLLLRIIKKTRTRCAQAETKRIVFFFPESSNPTFDIDRIVRNRADTCLPIIQDPQFAYI